MITEVQVRSDCRNRRVYRAVVEDFNPGSRELLRAILEANDVDVFEVDLASSVAETAQAVLPHIVLLDVNALSAESLAVVQALRATPGCRSIPLVAMSPTQLYPDPRAMTKAGFTAVLTKPLTPAAVRYLLAQYLPHLEAAPVRHKHAR